mmetsp:Transcript_12768/g.40344  ORF Transcript_12768/g.40344 Transcript_12768/m.40344 type:complete len:136 (+) Transcript_12768:39-446(+)
MLARAIFLPQAAAGEGGLLSMEECAMAVSAAIHEQCSQPSFTVEKLGMLPGAAKRPPPAAPSGCLPPPARSQYVSHMWHGPPSAPCARNQGGAEGAVVGWRAGETPECVWVCDAGEGARGEPPPPLVLYVLPTSD